MNFIDFEFNEKRLSDFNSIPCIINSSTGAIETSMGADITWNTIKNNHSFNSSITSVQYDEQYTVSFELCKNPCGEIRTYTDVEVRQIMRWLNTEKFYKFKPIYKGGELFDIYYVGSFNAKAIVLYGECIGFSVTFQSNSPYAFGDLCSYDCSLAENETFSVICDSDRDGYLYPIVKITCKKDGDLILTNNSIKKETTTLCNCKDGEIITINGNTKIVESSMSSQHEYFYKDFNNVFPKIFCDKDITENIISCSIPCELHIELTPIRKIGVF